MTGFFLNMTVFDDDGDDDDDDDDESNRMAYMTVLTVSRSISYCGRGRGGEGGMGSQENGRLWLRYACVEVSSMIM